MLDINHWSFAISVLGLILAGYTSRGLLYSLIKLDSKAILHTKNIEVSSIVFASIAMVFKSLFLASMLCIVALFASLYNVRVVKPAYRTLSYYIDAGDYRESINRMVMVTFFLCFCSSSAINQLVIEDNNTLFSQLAQVQRENARLSDIQAEHKKLIQAQNDLLLSLKEQANLNTRSIQITQQNIGQTQANLNTIISNNAHIHASVVYPQNEMLATDKR